jgi:hypothetical protein
VTASISVVRGYNTAAMLLRRCFFAFSVLLLACSSSSKDDQTNGPVFDASGDMAMDEPPDASPDAPPPDASNEAGHKDAGHDASDAKSEGGPVADGASEGGTCKGTLALAGGTASGAFGATSVDGAAWTFTSLTSSATTNPALVPFGGGFVAVFTAATTKYLQYSAYASSTWSTAANATGSSCVGPAAALGAPGLAAIGTTLHTVYLGTDNKFYHGSYTSSAWDCESDPLTPSGGTQSFGPSPPAAASVGSTLTAVFDGSNNDLYSQSWTASAWAATQQVTGASVGTIPPTVITVNGVTSDLLLVYIDEGDNVLYWAISTAGTWSAPAVTNAAAISTSPVSMAETSSGSVVLVFEGTDNNPYFMTIDPTAASPVWSTPATLVTGNEALTTPPTVAPGICGADAVAEIVQSTGVEVFTLASGAWSTPTLLSAAGSPGYATIASSP